ncbi:MAG: prolipoprotein diacylglyceryl transferase [Rikenellaceae bacterium]|jgi:phosphatidylglycerol:prolipoprotein diacylglycerol transferase
MISPLFITWGPSPDIFSIGSVHIRYYSILFVSGFIIGFYLFVKFFKREGISLDILDKLLYALLFAAVVGARLGHCLFYEPDYYLANPIEILKIWNGGLASHGGAIGILLTMWWFVAKYGKKYHFDFLWLMDRLGIATALAGSLIRLGNLMNSEIYGNPTNLPWGFIFTLRGETVPKHPTQLYESIAYLIIFLILMHMYRKWLPKLKRGTLFGVFLILLFTARFLIEYVKEPQVAFEQGMPLNMGQLLSLPFIITGFILLIYSIKKGKPAMIEQQQKKKPVSKQVK